MKAILKFNLDDPDDRMEHERCIKATDMALVLWELCYNSKKSLEDTLSADFPTDPDQTVALTALDKVFERFNDLLEEHSLDIDKIIT